MKGYDAAAHVLACFGGAGGQHACAIATALGMKTIFVHRWEHADGLPLPHHHMATSVACAAPTVTAQVFQQPV